MTLTGWPRPMSRPRSSSRPSPHWRPGCSPAPWPPGCRRVTGDEVYGADPALRSELEIQQQVGYVLAIGCDRRVPTAAGPQRADEIAAGLPRSAWQQLSAGAGAKGQRVYEWA